MTSVAGLGSNGWLAGATSAGSMVAADLKALEADLKGTGKGATLDPVAKLLGMTTKDLQSALKSGQKLGAIAQAHGKSVNDIEAALVQTIQDHLNAAVRAGKISQGAATNLLQAVRTRVGAMVTGQAPRGTVQRRATTAAGMSLLDAMAANNASGAPGGSTSLLDLLSKGSGGTSTSTSAFSGGLADYLA